MVSFTFDDIYESAAITGGQMLERYGARGTFYVALGLTGGRDGGGLMHSEDNLRVLASAGHEIGCHTYGHLACGDVTSRAYVEDVRKNRERFQELGLGCGLVNFAFPYGQAEPFTKKALFRHFRSLRGTQPGINSGTCDFGMLKANRLYERSTTLESIRNLINECGARRGWLIFYTHDVARNPSEYGCTPGLLEAAISEVLKRNLHIVTVQQAGDAIRTKGGLRQDFLTR